MAGDHAVDAVAQGAEIAIEARHIDARVDLSGIVFAPNAVDFLVDVADAALHLVQPAQDIAGLVVAHLRQRHVEVTARERVQRGGGHLQRRAGDTDCPDQHRAADQCCNDAGAQQGRVRERQRHAGDDHDNGQGDCKRGGEPQLCSDRETV